MEREYDVVIIGSGPAGLSAAVYARRAMLKTLVIEKAGYSGGQIVNTSEVDNYLGMKGVSGFDMAMTFRSHAESFGAEFMDGEVTNVNRRVVKNAGAEELSEDNGIVFDIKIADGTYVQTKAVIIATGASYRKLGVVGEAEHTGKGVSYCATCDGAFYKNKEVVVVGGGDVALGDAIYLSKIAAKVYLVHRRDELRGARLLQDKIFETENIDFIPDSVVESINDDGAGRVSSVDIYNKKNGQKSTVNATGVFVAIGMTPSTDFINDLVETDSRGYIIAGEDGVTGTEGVFAAGDVRTKELRQVITAVSDGANAAASVERFLNIKE